VFGCTTAVISGKYTKDGRPLLLKNRDTDALKNVIKYIDAQPYSFIGLVNSNDLEGKSIWIGNNSAGFAIMNSASYNLNVGDTLEQSGLEGRLMQRALQYCKDINDFQNFLDTLPKPYLLEANFGVIDASGGAAYFELGNHKFVKIDANDPAVAPFGYIIRSNYSFTGEMGIGGGYIRYQTASELLYQAVSTNTLDAEFIIQKFFRSLKHSLTGDDLTTYANLAAATDKYVQFRDFIPQKSTSSAVVVHGVLPSENPDYTTLWSITGFPLTSVAMPFWIKGGVKLPEIAGYNENLKNSQACHAALIFKEKCFPVRFGKTEAYYLNINVLINRDETGYMQLLKQIEDKIITKTSENLEHWRSTKIYEKEVQDYYLWMNSYIKNGYSEKLNYQWE
jgi:hypothetical protein